MLTDDEKFAYWSRFHEERRERKRRNDAFLGPGHERRAAQVRRVLTGQPVIEAVSGAAQAVTSFVSAAAAYTRDILEGFNFIKAEPAATEMEAMETPRKPRSNLSPEAFREQLIAELNRLNPGRDTIIDAGAMNAVVPVSNASIQAGAYINQPHRDIIAAAQYGFKDESVLRTLLLELDQPHNEAKATEIFIRATAQFVLSDLAEHDPETTNLAAFALAIKDMRPDIATPEMFDELERRLVKFTGQPSDVIKSKLEPIRETHALDALIAGYKSLVGPAAPEHDTTLMVAGSDEANAALARGYEQMQGGGDPIRHNPPKQGGNGPNGKPDV